jgi:hypothetical protein
LVKSYVWRVTRDAWRECFIFVILLTFSQMCSKCKNTPDFFLFEEYIFLSISCLVVVLLPRPYGNVKVLVMKCLLKLTAEDSEDSIRFYAE